MCARVRACVCARSGVQYQAVGTQVVVRAGEVLYIPSFWFHYIVSQDGSIQCNTRSGTSLRGKEFIHQCGFPMGGY